jgi:hypothetical protein
MTQTFRNLCIYRVKKGKEDEFMPLIKAHAPALKNSGLITEEGVKAWRCFDIRDKTTCFAEVFAWNSPDAPELAHQDPGVMKVWEPMTPLLEKLEILKLEPL